MQYTVKSSYVKNAREGSTLITNSYTYDDVPYTVEKIYKHLVDRLKGVVDHYLYNANDKQVIDINSRVTLQFKEYVDGINYPSGYVRITLKNVSPTAIAFPVFRIPRNEFEVYTLVSLVQNIINATSLKESMCLIQNAYEVYYNDREYNAINVYINGVVFDITKEDKTFVCKPRIKGLDTVAKFDDLTDYYTVALTMYNDIVNNDVVAIKLIEKFKIILFNIEIKKSTTVYSFSQGNNDLLKITYVGPLNVNVKIFGAFDYTTTLDNCTSIIHQLIDKTKGNIDLLSFYIK